MIQVLATTFFTPYPEVDELHVLVLERSVLVLVLVLER
jgi:hypothetical protein